MSSSTNPSIGCVVEGHGEVQAVPVLLRRIALAMDPPAILNVRPPVRMHRSRIGRDGEVERFARLAAVHADAVLLVVDADEDCAAVLAPTIQARLEEAVPDKPVAAVLAVCEFEAWFLASAASLAGQRRLRADIDPPPDPDTVRGAKEWLTSRMGGSSSYGEVADQAGFSARIDLDVTTARSRSFRKLRQEVEHLVDAQR